MKSSRIAPFIGKAPSLFYYWSADSIAAGRELPEKFLQRVAYVSTNSSKLDHYGFMIHSGSPRDPGHPVSVFWLPLGAARFYFPRQGRQYGSIDSVAAAVSTGLNPKTAQWEIVMVGQEIGQGNADALERRLISRQEAKPVPAAKPEKPYVSTKSTVTFFPNATGEKVALLVDCVGEPGGTGTYRISGSLPGSVSVSETGDPNRIEEVVERLFCDGLGTGRRKVEFQFRMPRWQDHVDGAIIVGAMRSVDKSATPAQATPQQPLA